MRPRSMKEQRPKVQEFLKHLDRLIEKLPQLKPRSVYKLGISKGVPRRVPVEGRCRACTDVAKPLWEYIADNKEKIQVCSMCSERLQRRFGRADAMSRTLPGSYGSGR